MLDPVDEVLAADAAPAFGDMSIRDFVGLLSSDAPAPGGGAASAVVGALGAALVSMVAELSVGYAATHGIEPLRADGVSSARALAARFLDLADADAAAFAAFGVAMRLPKWTEAEQAERGAAIRGAARAAAKAPLACMDACLELARLAERLAGRSNPNLASDLVVASVLAEGAARGAGANVAVNLPLVKDPAWEAATGKRLALLQHGVDLMASSARYVVTSGATRTDAAATTHGAFLEATGVA